MQTDLPLEGERLSPVGPCDVVVRRMSPREIPSEPPAGELLVDLRFPDGKGFAHAATESGFVLRYFGACEFHLSADLREVRAFVDPRSDDELAGILFGGNSMSVIVALRGEAFLHASGVAIHDAAIAFVGHSGAGKSTLATAFCAHGGALVADDMLRLDFAEDAVWCYSGVPEMRLRSRAHSLADGLQDSVKRTTVDGRLAVRPAAVRSGRIPLAAIILPTTVKNRDDFTLEMLAPIDALYELADFPAAGGWVSSRQVANHFRHMSTLVKRLPVIRATIPWDTPFEEGFVEGFLAGLEQLGGIRL